MMELDIRKSVRKALKLCMNSFHNWNSRQKFVINAWLLYCSTNVYLKFYLCYVKFAQDVYFFTQQQ